MDIADRLELHELPGRYGDIIDDRDWEQRRPRDLLSVITRQVADRHLVGA
ncbi:MAG: hypothetical protein OXH86_20635 [Acidimicrobiaceae bacterium]|nr:hypothetical protein [Acidimicrobiaceae bacterium]MDE0321618.1 hypothetical protein [Acidimicrobiaceae bacterium]MDE0499752.1 hypothetical protein [Acidimicrobiaceae bacterium]